MAREKGSSIAESDSRRQAASGGAQRRAASKIPPRTVSISADCRDGSGELECRQLPSPERVSPRSRAINKLTIAPRSRSTRAPPPAFAGGAFLLGRPTALARNFALFIGVHRRNSRSWITVCIPREQQAATHAPIRSRIVPTLWPPSCWRSDVCYVLTLQLHSRSGRSGY